MEYDLLLEEFQKKNNLSFKNPSLLKKAFTHSSYANEKNCESNERLEFLGDAVLQIAVSEFLYENYPDENEGFLSKTRAKNVKEPALCSIARTMELGTMLLLGNGEEITGGRDKDSNLADAFEALLGAVYLDRGFVEIFKILDRYFFTFLLSNNLKKDHDFKSNLQEYVQADDKRSIEYRLIKEDGPPHNKIFTIAVYMDGIEMGIGEGKSKKSAEQNAAKETLAKVAVPEGE